MDIEVCPAKAEDLAPWMALAEQVADLFGPMPGFDALLDRKIRQRQAYCARWSGDAASFLGAVLVGGRGGEHWIRWLAVSPDCRCRGIGRKLVEAAVAVRANASHLYVDTFCEGHAGAGAARRLYERCGFKPIAIVHTDGAVRERYIRQFDG